MVYCVGLTGRIASGKSTAAAYFKSVGIDIISADVLAKALTLNGQPAFDEIKHHFGASILTEQGELNRRALRHRIISDAHERLWLEKCLHPRIPQAITSAIEHVRTFPATLPNYSASFPPTNQGNARVPCPARQAGSRSGSWVRCGF